MTQTLNTDQPDTQVEKLVKEPVKETEKGIDAVIAHLVDMSTRLAKLEERLPVHEKDLEKSLFDLEDNLRRSISEAREEQSRVSADTMKSLEDRLTKIEGLVDGLVVGGKEEKDEQPRTNVDELLQEKKLAGKAHAHGAPFPPVQLPQGETEIKPPGIPKGIRGRRMARRGKESR